MDGPKIASGAVVIASLLFLIADIFGLYRIAAQYRVLTVALFVLSALSFFLVPDPRTAWIGPTATAEWTALCALERQRAHGAQAVDPATGQAILNDNELLQAIRKACQSARSGAADRD